MSDEICTCDECKRLDRKIMEACGFSNNTDADVLSCERRAAERAREACVRLLDDKQKRLDAQADRTPDLEEKHFYRTRAARVREDAGDLRAIPTDQLLAEPLPSERNEGSESDE